MLLARANAFKVNFRQDTVQGYLILGRIGNRHSSVDSVLEKNSMADEEDIRLARSGESDLIGCDFRGADLRGIDLSGRDLERARFEHANLSDANLSGANLKQTDLTFVTGPRIDLSNTNLDSRALGHSDFSGGNFQGTNFTRSHLNLINFDGADLRSADFSHVTFVDGIGLAGCKIDDNTKFDDALVSRALSRDNAFRNYNFARGKLVRKDSVPSASLEQVVSVSDDTAAPLASSDDATPHHDEVNSFATASSVTISLSPTQVPALIKALDEIDLELDKLPVANSEKAQIRAYVLAARSLADAPEPPVDLIWEILNRANHVSGIASLFVAILAIFLQ